MASLGFQGSMTLNLDDAVAHGGPSGEPSLVEDPAPQWPSVFDSGKRVRCLREAVRCLREAAWK